MVIEVLVEISAKKIDQTFTYLVPTHLKNKIQIGIRVLVPFGNRTLEGFILNIKEKDETTYELKEIIDIIDDEPILTDEMLELGHYISKKTFSTLISAYQTMLPTALKAKKNITINKKYITYLKLINNEFKPKNNAQINILDLFQNEEYIIKNEANKISLSAVKTLINKKVIEEIIEETYRLQYQNQKQNSLIELNNEQQIAVIEVIKNLKKFIPFLLYGVTGSGKTEVYMHIIEEVLKNKQEIIVLVPEISLTPQIISLFKKRFGNNIAILHSRLSNGEKYDEWRRIKRKEVSIVIGARSAIFAPFTNLGLIVIDEEHTSTYKQENNPRYNAIDIALNRAKKHKCPIILGSATPSIESYTRAKSGIYQLLNLQKRVNNNLPEVKLIDMKDEIKKGNRLISKILQEKIQDRLNKKEQILLLLNRRGYTTVITCHDCGYTDKCPKCDIPLTFHKNINKMKCHYCDYKKNLLITCPECKKQNINQFGIGTEKLEQIINEMFDAKTIRMDVDTTRIKGAHEKIITAFENKEYDILIGTQMIAKGLDFPNVTLVGVISGDASLNIPDFRSGERTFQLLNQVSGRAGRGDVKGTVIIQGFNIDHYSIINASTHNYLKFYQSEMQIRSLLKYPPYCNIALIKISSKDYNLAITEANKISSSLKQNTKQTIILGPASAAMPKINNIYYMQTIIKYKKLEDIYQELQYIIKHYQPNNKLSIEIDINPIRI